MTQQDIIDMAYKVGIKYRGFGDEFYSPYSDGVEIEQMQAFAQLVAEAKCKELAKELKKMPLNDTANSIAIWIENEML